MILRILKRAGAMHERIREYRKRELRKVQRDKNAAVQRAKEPRAEGLSLRAIGERLLKEKLYPARGRWVACGDGSGLLMVKGRRRRRSEQRELRAEGLSLRRSGDAYIMRAIGHRGWALGRWCCRSDDQCRASVALLPLCSPVPQFCWSRPGGSRMASISG